MAIYRIEWKRSALKDLKHIDRTAIPKTLSLINSLALNPLPFGSRKLYGSEETFRIRIGDYRVIYEANNDLLIIFIVRVRHRKKVYKP